MMIPCLRSRQGGAEREPYPDRHRIIAGVAVSRSSQTASILVDHTMMIHIFNPFLFFLSMILKKKRNF